MTLLWTILRVVLTFSGPSRKWAFQWSNHKCLFIAGACTRPTDSRAPRLKKENMRGGCLLLTNQVCHELIASAGHVTHLSVHANIRLTHFGFDVNFNRTYIMSGNENIKRIPVVILVRVKSGSII